MIGQATIRSRILFLFAVSSLLLLLVGLIGILNAHEDRESLSAIYANLSSSGQINASARAEYERAMTRHRRGFLASIAAIAGGILIAFATTWNLISAIGHSLSLVDQQLKELASGEADLTKRITVKTFQEVTAISENLNRVLNKLAELVGQVQSSALMVGTSASEISASAKQLQTTVSQQVASTNQVAATASQISATSQELVHTMSEVAHMSQQARGFAGTGQESLQNMQATMQQMEEAGKSISARLAAINEKATKITSVVTTITKVAQQTNLLSLNAAIEAEKAGEFGQGFAVVAREIRRLADQTDVATLDISRMVRDMTSAVSAGVMGMDKFAEEVRRGVEEVRLLSDQLNRIIEQVQELTPRFETVNDGMQSQSTAAEQIRQAMLELSQGAQQTAESLQVSGSAIEELSNAARAMQQEVDRFRASNLHNVTA